MSCIDGFRLPAPSECSLRSKARIDALFEDSRSVCSSSWCAASLAPAEDCRQHPGDEDRQRRVNSAVQARIEAMFASVEAESAVPGECAAAVLPVKYMGAAPVGGRVASVRGLQEPLRQLVERIGDSVNAELEVSRRGLTFRTNELHEKNNPFRRIAVWSALKLQTRRRLNSNNPQDLLFAFVPLVADSTSSPTTNQEDRHADLYRTMRGLSKEVDNYPPIFAVVMRRPGAARLLECHAFACRCEEDAIAAAATLYRALLADLEATARRPRQTNGLGCVSLASVVSSMREASPLSGRRLDGHVVIENVPPPPPPLPDEIKPVRPPRVKKNSVSSNTDTEVELSSSPCTNISVIEKVPRRKIKKSDIKVEDVQEARGRLFSSPSSNQESNANDSDVFTKRNDSESSPQSSREQTSEERRMNAKNKIYGSRSSRCQAVVSGEVQVIENVQYDDEKSSLDNAEVYQEKSSTDRQVRRSSYDFDCCTENSLYESSRIYAKARDPAVSMNTRNSTRSRKSQTSKMSSSSAARRSNYPTRPSVPPPKKPQTHSEQRRRSVASGSDTVARHRDHFRDVDKICSLGSEQIYGRHLAGRIDRIYDVTRPGRHVGSTTRSDISEQSVRSTKRLSRVATMDRPLRKTSSSSSQTPSHENQHRLQQHQESRRQHRRKSRAGSEPPTTRTEAAAVSSMVLKRSQSDLDVDRGDLLTRVELPRRGSFLKQPGSVRKRDGLDGGGGGTPLGFSELFDEFRNQEGLTSVDDILTAIIDPEGMSFNDLKPLYKEFLLKLAATLTQDELYQRSASIMRRRRRRQRRASRASSASNRPACLLRRAIKRSVSRLRSSSAASAPTEFTSVIFPARKLNSNNNNNTSSNNDRSSYGSSASSCDAMRSLGLGSGAHRHKVLASKLGRRRSMTRSKSRIGQTTSEDSDTCRRLGRNIAAANRSSSGYVSCSECSYDSESCTCVSADKCYCSLSRKVPPQNPTVAALQAPAMICSCDTDSCSESNKCYCARKPMQQQHQQQQQPSILEQLRQKGIVPSESTLSRGASPDRTRAHKNSDKFLTSSKSLEFLRVRSSSIRGSVDNLALDYDLFRPGGRRSSNCSSSSEKVLVVSARDPQGRLIYVGGTEHGDAKNSSRRCSSKHRHRGNSATNGHHEALSIKKSAEIAAVFGGHQRLGRRTSSASSLRSSISLEAGLGYLP